MLARMDIPDATPVTLPEWREFLGSYSADYLKVATEAELACFDDVQLANRWFGYEPATEYAVRRAEERIGRQLPPSYRNFLLASNGWRCIDRFVDELRTVDEIDLLPTADPELWQVWADSEDAALLEHCVLVSGASDGDYWLLDASTVRADEEWTAYSWMAHDGLDPEACPSFGALVLEARRFFEELSGREGRPVNPGGADDVLAEGRRQALAGEVDAARASFHTAHAKGSALAPYLAGLLISFTEPGPSAENYIRNNVINERILSAVDDLHLRAELIPLYLNVWRDGATQGRGYLARWFADYLPAVEAISEPLRALPQGPRAGAELASLAARAANYVPPVLPEAPDFQQALDQARNLIAANDLNSAWQVLERALPLWESDSPFRIAPVILRVDPVFRSIVTPDRYRSIVEIARGGGDS